MGSCTSSTAPLDQAHPSAATLSAAAGNAYGTTVAIGCGYAGSVANSVSCPSGWSGNGETGSCYFCNGNTGTTSIESSGCTGASCAVAGRKLSCKLTSYMGDQTTCCQTGLTSSSSGTCNPNWGNGDNYSSGTCDNVMQSYCTSNNYANWNNTQCQKWYTARSSQDAEKALMLGYCKVGDNIKTDGNCNTFCTANPGMCDTYVASYCAVHPEDQGFCGCYNLPKIWTEGPLTAGAAKPACYVPACSSGGVAYRSVPMQTDATHCPSIAICNQTLTANMTNSEVAALNQSCNIIQTTDTTNNTVTTPVAAKSAAATTANGSSISSITISSSKTTAIIIGIILIFIILSLLSGSAIYSLN